MEKIWVGLIGVIVGGVLATWREWWMEKRNRKKDATFLAIRIVCILDDFVKCCAAVAKDDGFYYGQSNSYAEPKIEVQTPDLDFESLSVNWNSIPPNLMYKVLSLPNKIKDEKQSLYDLSRHFSDADFIDERRLRYANLGLEAQSITEQFRKKYHIIKQKFQEHWDPIKIMSDLKIENLEREISYEKQYKERQG